jgi:hypothetical protein
MALLLALCSAVAIHCVAQDVAPGREILCSAGYGNFQANSTTGVTLHVGASRNGQLATRTCEAILSWSNGALSVATQASQLDLDAFGIDLGLGGAVATFQVKKSGDNCCMDYLVYSLEKPPHLLRTITGSDFFTTADTDLDGRVEIWAHDAAAVQDFERLGPAELDFPPSMVLRFVHGKLLDVSSEFQAHFDSEIAELRQQLQVQDARDFKNSDGKLASAPSLSVEQIHALRAVKGKVLGIVWSYLYSGREQQAWNVLNEMWPAGDMARIRTAILDARARGIRAQVDAIAVTSVAASHERTHIFDVSSESGSGKRDLQPPVAILLRQPNMGANPDPHAKQSESLLDLVIDSAGKVRSARLAGKTQPVNAALLSAVSSWKFIPAFKSGKAVACSLRIGVSLKQ